MTLTIEGIDPCSLLTESQRTQLGVRGQGTPDSRSPTAEVQGPFCGWSNLPQHPSSDYAGGFVTNRGAEFALGLEPLRSVQGFGATTTTSLGTDPRWYCAMFVDIAPGAALSASYDNGPRDYPGMNHGLACDKAQQLADAMLTTLRSRQPH
jgi:hypothetical protein